MKFWMPMLESWNDNFPKLIESFDKLISGLAGIIINSLVLIFSVALRPFVALYTYWEDCKEWKSTYSRLKKSPSVRYGALPLIEARMKVFPYSRVYQVMYKVCVNENRKAKARALKQLQEIDLE
jgi:hypothetical protein